MNVNFQESSDILKDDSLYLICDTKCAYATVNEKYIIEIRGNFLQGAYFVLPCHLFQNASLAFAITGPNCNVAGSNYEKLKMTNIITIVGSLESFFSPICKYLFNCPTIMFKFTVCPTLLGGKAINLLPRYSPF